MTMPIPFSRRLSRRLLASALCAITLGSPLCQAAEEAEQPSYPAVHNTATQLKPKVVGTLESVDQYGLGQLDDKSSNVFTWMSDLARDAGMNPLRFHHLMELLLTELTSALEEHYPIPEDDDDLHNVLLRMSVYMVRTWGIANDQPGYVFPTVSEHPVFNLRNGLVNTRGHAKGQMDESSLKRRITMNLLFSTLVANQPVLFSTRFHAGSDYYSAWQQLLIGPVFDEATGRTRIVLADYTPCQQSTDETIYFPGSYTLDQGKLGYTRSTSPRPTGRFSLPTCAVELYPSMDLMLGYDSQGRRVHSLMQQLIQNDREQWEAKERAIFAIYLEDCKGNKEKLLQLLKDNDQMLSHKLITMLGIGQLSYQKASDKMTELGQLLGTDSQSTKLTARLALVIQALEANPKFRMEARMLSMHQSVISKVIDHQLESKALKQDDPDAYQMFVSRWISLEQQRVTALLGDQLAQLSSKDAAHAHELMLRVVKLTQSRTSIEARSRIQKYIAAFDQADLMSTQAGTTLKSVQDSLDKTPSNGIEFAYDPDTGNTSLMIGSVDIFSPELSDKDVENLVEVGISNSPLAAQVREAVAQRINEQIDHYEVDIKKSKEHMSDNKKKRGLLQIYKATGIVSQQPDNKNANIPAERTLALHRLRRFSLLVSHERYRKKGLSVDDPMRKAAERVASSISYMRWRNSNATAIALSSEKD
ncbi:hypothetical protein [Parendozoicomonas haliclonae]|uniref:Secreted protein n=1 Tax=Parendozoicomonas haliclonae TaxID=1960125 RepID=A0A1X7AL68_9GAMM|nr:hypothetical protein [Parendozoicomonas haliclonae]SMA47934.1 hypothetical protein EHSB41UT_02609 [Parendozoicomonas haliclonae]